VETREHPTQLGSRSGNDRPFLTLRSAPLIIHSSKNPRRDAVSECEHVWRKPDPVQGDGPYGWVWFDDTRMGETYGVRIDDEVVCYTGRTKQGWEDAALIARALNALDEGEA